MWLKEELRKYKRDGKFVLSGGDVNEVYFDLKEAFGNPRILECTADALYSIIDGKPDFVAARGLGGITIATAISLKQGINLTLIRSEQKEYGMRKVVEGYIPEKGEAGIIVDDVFTTGQNMISAIHEVWRCGADVSAGYVVIKRNPFEIGILVKHLFTLEDLL